MISRIARATNSSACLFSVLLASRAWPQQTLFQCRPLSSSTLTPSANVDDAVTNDCAYRAGNLWWVDYVAGSLLWTGSKPVNPVVVAIFDDGAYIDHEELR